MGINCIVDISLHLVIVIWPNSFPKKKKTARPVKETLRFK